MLSRLSQPAGRPHLFAALILAAGCAATVGTALIFEHQFGYIPCALCLEQRTPYYLAVPVALVAAILATRRPDRGLPVHALLGLVGLAMLYGHGLAIYHAGVEWHFWAGPAGCAAAGNADLGGDLLATIDAVHPPACDQAAGRFLGLSFAGWNVLASLLFAAIALRAAFSPTSRRA
jgi:disulfide bond formation protein DsbB